MIKENEVKVAQSGLQALLDDKVKEVFKVLLDL